MFQITNPKQDLLSVITNENLVSIILEYHEFKPAVPHSIVAYGGTSLSTGLYKLTDMRMNPIVPIYTKIDNKSMIIFTSPDHTFNKHVGFSGWMIETIDNADYYLCDANIGQKIPEDGWQTYNGSKLCPSGLKLIFYY